MTLWKCMTIKLNLKSTKRKSLNYIPRWNGKIFYFKRTKRKAKNKSPHFVLQSTFLGKRNYGTMKYARGCQQNIYPCENCTLCWVRYMEAGIMKEYLYIADPIKMDHLQPIFLHKSPTKGIEPPCRTTLVVVRNTKSSYLEQGCKDWQFVMVTLRKVVVISIGGIVTH